MNDNRYIRPRDDGAPTRSTAARREWLRAAITAYGERFRDDLHEQYGWPDLQFRVRAAGAGQLVVEGETALPQTARSFTRGLLATFGPAEIAVAFHVRRPEHGWFIPRVPVMRVWRDLAATTPATEWAASDGAVRVLARAGVASLVRCPDGTAGWTRDPLRPCVVPAPPSPRPTIWRDAARSFLGVPYRAGGTTPAGIDCSGLVQRVYRAVEGKVLPRHSGDQFALLPLRSGERREGQLVFVNGAGESPFHVGVLLRRGSCDWSVVHASSTRAVVVEDPYDEYLRRGGERAR
jgi:cell wall-associated NlpC family hydrolase